MRQDPRPSGYPPPLLVHFLHDREQAIPLCEEWRGEPSWTTVRDVVTCPFCLSRLRGTSPFPMPRWRVRLASGA